MADLFLLMTRLPPTSTLFPYTTLFRSVQHGALDRELVLRPHEIARRLLHRSESTRLNSSHGYISYAVCCLKKKNRTDCARSPVAGAGPPADPVMSSSTGRRGRRGRRRC